MRHLLLLAALLFPALVISTAAYADAITEACKRDVPSETVNQIEHDKPGVQRSKVRMAMAGGLPEAEYSVQTKTAVCIAEKITLALKDPANFYGFCPGIKSKLRIDCFNQWLKHQDVGYASQVAQLASTAYTLTAMDLQASKSQKAALALLLDTMLVSLEKYSTTKNVAYRFDQAHLKERLEIRQREFNDFTKVKQELLSRLDADLTQLAPSARKPASVKVTSNVPLKKSERMKASAKTAAEWKLESISRQFKTRIAKLKKF